MQFIVVFDQSPLICGPILGISSGLPNFDPDTADPSNILINGTPLTSLDYTNSSSVYYLSMYQTNLKPDIYGLLRLSLPNLWLSPKRFRIDIQMPDCLPWFDPCIVVLNALPSVDYSGRIVTSNPVEILP